jgi:DNA invertase Pin-like site-specific DNA recombinase
VGAFVQTASVVAGVAERAMRAVAYCRVSTAKQGEGLSLESQRERIATFVESQGWEATYRHDAGTGSKVGPELSRTLRELDLGMFDVLVVARLDRLSRSVGNFAVILERAKARGWKVVCLDPMVDMTTPYGEAMAGMAAVFAQLEHRLISLRQIESVAARRAAGTYAPAGQAARKVPDKAIRRMVRLSQRGMTSQAIARQLKIEGHHPPNGGQWKPRLVRKYVAAAKETT